MYISSYILNPNQLQHFSIWSHTLDREINNFHRLKFSKANVQPPVHIARKVPNLLATATTTKNHRYTARNSTLAQITYPRHTFCLHLNLLSIYSSLTTALTTHIPHTASITYPITDDKKNVPELLQSCAFFHRTPSSSNKHLQPTY